MDIPSIILGIVQGLTEFLPISSSGHLTIVSYLFHKELPLAFDILLHIATLLAIIIYTFPLIVSMLISLYRNIFGRKSYNVIPMEIQYEDQKHIQLIICLCLSTIATIPMGLFLKDKMDNFSVSFVGIMLFCTAIVLLIPFLIPSTRASISQSIKNTNVTTLPTISYLYAILLGFAQGFAIFPGISRSGITITCAVLLGLSYQHATRYSFLMAIPAILASFVLSISDLPELMDSISYGTLIVSMGLTFITGLIGLRALSIIAKQGKIWVFSIYLFVVAGFVLVFI